VSQKAPLMSHLTELRHRLIKASIAVIIGSVVAFVFRTWIFDVLVAPFESYAEGRQLAFFRPTEAFSLFMRLSLFAGFVLASPVVIYQAWAFVSPALTRREKRRALPVVAVLILLFLGFRLLVSGAGHRLPARLRLGPDRPGDRRRLLLDVRAAVPARLRPCL
jgi:Tat protein translocase TatC